MSVRDPTTDLNAEATDALRALLYRLADDEFVLAERYTEWQIFAPTLESDLAISNIAQDELGHARLWYDLLEALGESEVALIWERPPERWVHSTLVELPFEEGDWADLVVRSYLYDTAERVRLDALAGSAYPPLADRIGKVSSEEEYHRQHAENWLDRLAGQAPGAPHEAHERMQRAVDRLFPYAATIFVPGEHEETIVEYGFRTESIHALRTEWLDIVVPTLEAYGLDVPDPEDGTLPTQVGRNGTHTDAWEDLYDDFTRTYEQLDHPAPVSLRTEEFQS